MPRGGGGGGGCDSSALGVAGGDQAVPEFSSERLPSQVPQSMAPSLMYPTA